MTNRVTTADLMTAILAQTAAINGLVLALTPAKPVETAPTNAYAGFKPKAAKANVTQVKPKAAGVEVKPYRIDNIVSFAKSSGRDMAMYMVANAYGKTYLINVGLDKKAPQNGVLVLTADTKGNVKRFA